MAKVINKGIKFIKTKFFKTGLEQETNKVIVKGELKIKELSNVSRKIASEGIVLLKNENNILPLDINENVCFFGRCQIDYFCVGYGSGGDVCPPYKKSLIDGLNDLKVKYDKRLSDIYKKWTSKKSNIPDEGYWGNWPMSFPEMELNDKEVKNASKRSNKAVIVIGRAAGEDRENKLIEGSYYLTNKEKKLLDKVTHYFDNVILVMDCGNMIDLNILCNCSFNVRSSGSILRHIRWLYFPFPFLFPFIF
jgi:beta-glucosidase